MKHLIPLAVLALAACASSTDFKFGPVGHFYHYVRSNQDGTMPERIYMYRNSATQMSVSKQVSNCTNAAYVTADLAAGSDEVQRYAGGRLTREATQDAFALLTFDSAARTLTTRVQLPNGAINEVLAVADRPYRVYDFDLADINAFMAGRAAPRRDFSFSVVLAWPEGTPERFVTTRGIARARFIGIERSGGEPAARYEVAGALNGPLWLDADEGHVVEARFREPNHPGYRDFHLVLRGHSPFGPHAFPEVLAAHWRNCPAG